MESEDRKLSLSEEITKVIDETYVLGDKKSYYQCFLNENNYYDIQEYLKGKGNTFVRQTDRGRKILINLRDIVHDYVDNKIAMWEICKKYDIPRTSLLEILSTLEIIRKKQGDNYYTRFNKENFYSSREGNINSCSKLELTIGRFIKENIIHDLIFQHVIKSNDGDYYHLCDYFSESLNLVIEYDGFVTHSEENDKFRNESIIKLGYNLLVLPCNLGIRIEDYKDMIFSNLDKYLYPSRLTYLLEEEIIEEYKVIKKLNLTNKELGIHEVLKRSDGKAFHDCDHWKFNHDISYEKIISYLDNNYITFGDLCRFLNVSRNCIIKRIKMSSGTDNYRNWVSYYCKLDNLERVDITRSRVILKDLGIKNDPEVLSLSDLIKFSKSFITLTYNNLEIIFNKYLIFKKRFDKIYRISVLKFIELYNENKIEEIYRISGINSSLRFNYGFIKS